jgi:O-methyltransferase
MASLRRIIKMALFHTPLARFQFVRWQYNFTPRQLPFFCDCLDHVSSLPGPILEVGCFRGATTVWLNRHMDDIGMEKPYFALDTFSGFTSVDVQHEIKARGKQSRIASDFIDNHKASFEYAMVSNGIRRVTSIEADAGKYDHARFHEIAFVLLDVDLYLPTKSALQSIWPHIVDGGIIVVDDCKAQNSYDGRVEPNRPPLRHLLFQRSDRLERVSAWETLGQSSCDPRSKPEGCPNVPL